MQDTGGHLGHAGPARGLQQFLVRLLQIGFRPFPARYVAGDRQLGKNFAFHVAQGAGMGFHPAACAFQTDDLKLCDPRFSLENALAQRPEPRVILRGYHLIHGAAHDLFGILSFDHGQTRWIHVQNRSVRGDQFDAFRLRLQDQAQAMLALGQLLLSPLALGDVLDRANITNDVARFRTDGGCARLDPADFARSREEAKLTGEFAFFAVGVIPGDQRRGGVIRMKGLPPAFTETLLQRQARDALPIGVGVETAPVRVSRNDSNGVRSAQGAESLLAGLQLIVRGGQLGRAFSHLRHLLQTLPDGDNQERIFKQNPARVFEPSPRTGHQHAVNGLRPENSAHEVI